MTHARAAERSIEGDGAISRPSLNSPSTLHGASHPANIDPGSSKGGHPKAVPLSSRLCGNARPVIYYSHISGVRDHPTNDPPAECFVAATSSSETATAAQVSARIFLHTAHTSSLPLPASPPPPPPFVAVVAAAATGAGDGRGDARSISARWPATPNPVTSVQALAP